LTYALEQDGYADKVVLGALARNLPIPDKILNAPELLQGLEYYRDLFFILDTERRFAEGPIPFSALQQFEHDAEDLEETWYIISRLDANLMEYFREKRKKEDGKTAKKGRRSGKK
jgi:hypothetical protein